MTDTVHIMVDLETWGTTPGSDIRSIGAVVFDPVTRTLGQEFYQNVVNLPMGGGDSQPRYPLTRDPLTVEWWSKQSNAAQERLASDVVDLKLGLARFHDWWEWATEGAEATFWAHGPHFDEAILAACYRAIGQPVPWHYRAPRDCRTAFEMAGDPCHVEFEGVEHDALADAKNQARRVIEAYRLIAARTLPIECDDNIAEAIALTARCCGGGAADIWDAIMKAVGSRAGHGGFTVSKVAHDQRVTELLEANNREVERRRAAESLLRSAAEGLENAASEASYHDNSAAYREHSGLALSIRKHFA